MLIQALKNGRTVEAKFRFEIEQHEFALQGNCLMRGIRVYIPKQLRTKILEELHSTHFGITRMKSLARGYCWSSEIDKDIEHIVQNCTECQLTRPDPVDAPLHPWETPTAPFQRKPQSALVVEFLRLMHYHIMRTINTEATIRTCRRIFATHALPHVFVSDHGVQFKSEAFQQFLKANGIRHKLGAPYHPATNGQAERYVQTIKNKLKAAIRETTDIDKALCDILLTCRRTAHPTTGQSPCMLLMNRQLRTRLDLLLPRNTSKEEGLQQRFRTLNIGDRVAARDFMSKETRIWKRHIDQLRKVGPLVGRTDTSSNGEPSFVCEENETVSDTHNDAIAVDIVPPSVSVPENDNLPKSDHISDDNNLNQKKDIVEPQPNSVISSEQKVNVGVRHSTRIRKIPQRLDIVEPQPNSVISSEQKVNVGVRHSTRIRKIPQRLNL
ncbi:Integrase zinc binding domain [Popillia japonica]|uniref:RNA-directed DNA polymerase n=1 Tax=Popillia japonica TaxID=7064 RepID=A0AAW1KJF7_POPJA